MYQILQKFDIHWHDGGPSIAMMYHLRRVSDLLCNWKSCLLCYMKDVVLHCSIFFKWNKLVRVRVRVRVLRPSYLHNGISYTGKMASLFWIRPQGSLCCFRMTERGNAAWTSVTTDIWDSRKTFSQWSTAFIDEVLLHGRRDIINRGTTTLCVTCVYTFWVCVTSQRERWLTGQRYQ